MNRHLAEWERIISAENWAKGRLIANWTAARKDASDAKFASLFGGINAEAVRLLRRVHDRFFYSKHSYPGLLWNHFRFALEWEDAKHWLKLASDLQQTPDQMRIHRWEVKS